MVVSCQLSFSYQSSLKKNHCGLSGEEEGKGDLVILPHTFPIKTMTR